MPSGCLVTLAILAGGIAVVIHLAFSMLKNSEPYAFALELAQENPEVQAALGTPIEAGYLATGRIDLENDTGEAAINIPISGPIGSGIIYLEGEKIDGKWTYTTLVVELDETLERIRLADE